MALATPSGELEELVDESSGKEIVATPVVVDRFEDLMKKYEQGLDFGAREVWTKNNVHDVFLPSDINLFLQQTREYEDHVNYSENTGFFISQLIQNSYTAGHTDFELDVNSLKPIDYFTSNISGTKERRASIVIKGETGDACGSNAHHSTFIIKKAGHWCGWESKYSTFTIEKAGHKCGIHAENSTFTIGEAGDQCGYGVKHSTFTIEGAEYWCGSEAHHSTFKTHNPEQYEKFKVYISQNKENKLYLLSPNGSILQGGSW